MQGKKFYIASKLENAPQVRWLADKLIALGWEHTYDWTVHGSVQGDADRCREVSEKETCGVLEAEVIIFLLPGGRGTHTELGIAIGSTVLAAALCEEANIGLEMDERRIVVYSGNPSLDFGSDGTTCAFYHHPLVERFDDMDVMFGSLIGAH